SPENGGKPGSDLSGVHMESVPHLSFHFRYLRKVSWKDPYPFHMGRLLTAQQAAALLGTSKPTLRALIDRKVLVATKKTRGSGFQWVIREESVEAFLADHGRYDVDTVAARPSLKRLDQRLSALEVEVGGLASTAQLQPPQPESHE